MSRTKLLLCYFLLFSVSTGMLSAQSNLAFMQETPRDLLSEARYSQQPILLYFYTDWAEPCQQIKANTFSSRGLVNYIRSEYLAYKVDADVVNRGGFELISQYKVMFFPTFIVLSPNGEMIKQMVGYVSADELKAELQSARSQVPRRLKAPPIASNTTAVPSPTPAPKKEIAPEPIITKPVSTNPGPETPQNTSAYWVQVGVYSQNKNARFEANQLRNRYTRPVLVFGDDLGGRTVFRLLIGPFDKRQIADQFSRSFQQLENRGAIIKHSSQVR